MNNTTFAYNWRYHSIDANYQFLWKTFEFLGRFNAFAELLTEMSIADDIGVYSQYSLTSDRARIQLF